MNLFIFGAGASYGSDENKSLLPPLAKDLFAHLSNKYWDIANNKKAMLLKSLFEEDFEKGFLGLGKADPTFLSKFQRLMADFFFQYGNSIPITQNNLYFKLAKEVKERSSNIALATLNYERLLEISFRQFMPITINETMKKSEQIELCYPHGCCNLVVKGISATNGVLFTKGVVFNGSVEIIENSGIHRNYIVNEAIPPVMCYFEPSKFTASGANFIQAQRNKLDQLITEAKKIAIIGIKVREHDAHIWEPLMATNATIIYCGGREAAREYNIWRKGKTERNRDIVLSGYWNDEFDTINREML